MTRTIKLLDLYGDEVFALAVTDLVDRGLSDLGALAVACEKRRRAHAHPVPLDIPLPDHVDDRDVIPHDLERYDVRKP